MISFIKGAVEEINEQSIVVDVGGIGYALQMPQRALAGLTKRGESVKIYTHMVTKEDGFVLYGFGDAKERDMFIRLIAVTGVGPKSALGLLSVMEPSAIVLAVLTDDVAALAKAPGIGKKTAQRMALELKDKLKVEGAVGTALHQQQSTEYASGEKQDAIDALLALGYSRSEAVKGVLEVAIEGMSTEQIIKQTLRKLSS